MAKTIDEIIKKHYNEAVGGIVDKVPSALNRGEGTEREFYMLKIDLVDSTVFTWTRTHKTYLKLAHTFLSSVDEITRAFGADDGQVEYVGDSIIAYFRADRTDAISILKAAYFCRESALQMKNLDTTFSNYHFLTKTILHYGKLIMAKIGPRGDSFVTAIGPELHKACKMESRVTPGQGRASKEFREKLPGREKLILLKPNINEAVAPMAPVNPAPLSIESVLFNSQNQQTEGLNALRKFARPASIFLGTSPPLSTKSEVIDYSVKWDELAKYIATHNHH